MDMYMLAALYEARIQELKNQESAILDRGGQYRGIAVDEDPPALDFQAARRQESYLTSAIEKIVGRRPMVQSLDGEVEITVFPQLGVQLHKHGYSFFIQQPYVRQVLFAARELEDGEKPREAAPDAWVGRKFEGEITLSLTEYGFAVCLNNQELAEVIQTLDNQGHL